MQTRTQKLLHRGLRGAGLAVLAIAGLLQFSSTPAFAASSCLWTGVRDGYFSDADNWTNCNGTSPQNGDSITIDRSTAVADSINPFFNLPGDLTLTGINFTGAGTASISINSADNSGSIILTGDVTSNADTDGNGGYATDSIDVPIILGADVTVGLTPSAEGTFVFGKYGKPLDTAGHTLTLTGGNVTNNSGNIVNTLRLQGVLDGAGKIVTTSYTQLVVDIGSYSGTFNLAGPTLVFVIPPDGSTANVPATYVSGSGSLIIATQNDTTINMPLTLSGTGTRISDIARLLGTSLASTDSTSLLVYSTNGGTTTFTGPLTLESDVSFLGIKDAPQPGDARTIFAGSFTPNCYTMTTINKLDVDGITTGTLTLPEVTEDCSDEATPGSPSETVPGVPNTGFAPASVGGATAAGDDHSAMLILIGGGVVLAGVSLFLLARRRSTRG